MTQHTEAPGFRPTYEYLVFMYGKELADKLLVLKNNHEGKGAAAPDKADQPDTNP